MKHQKRLSALPILTSSLPWYPLKTTHKCAKFETVSFFCFPFRNGLMWSDFHQRLFRAAKRCLCGRKLVSVYVSCVFQRAANARTAGNLPTSIFSLTPSTMSHTGARASAGHEIQSCLCVLLSLRALQQKGQWGIAPRQKFWIFVFLHTYNKTTMYHTLVLGHSICTRMRDYLHRTIPAYAQI